MVVYLNAQLLTVPLSFLQTICRLGYALSPLAAASLVCTLLFGWIPIVSGIGQLAAGGWSLWAGSRMIWEGNEIHADKMYLVIYPVALYYVALTLLCILS